MHQIDKLHTENKSDTGFIVGHEECHVAPLIWPLFGDNYETQLGHALTNWLCERLRI